VPFKWEVTPEQAFGDLMEQYGDDIHAAIKQLANRYAPEIEAWMKSNAKWTDRTGNARQSLSTEVEELSSIAIGIVLGYGNDLDYGIFLELSNGGVWAIIGPALDYFAPKVWADVQALFSG